MTASPCARTIVYYDGACGLCAREVDFYKRIAREGVFCWRDLSQEPDALISRGVSRAAALKSLHAVDTNGRLHEGVDAFILIWRGLGGVWRLPAFLLSTPGLRWLAEQAYRAFAAWRFRRLGHCQLAARQEEEDAKRTAA